MSKGIAWWIWSRAQQALDGWIRSLIGEGRAYSLRFDPKAGASFVDWHTKEVVIDPTMVNEWGGEELLPLRWRNVSATIQSVCTCSMARC